MKQTLDGYPHMLPGESCNDFIDHYRLLARQLLLLLKSHKETCKIPDCGISVGSFQGLYESLVGRTINADERYYFM